MSYEMIGVFQLVDGVVILFTPTLVANRSIVGVAKCTIVIFLNPDFLIAEPILAKASTCVF